MSKIRIWKAIKPAQVKKGHTLHASEKIKYESWEDVMATRLVLQETPGAGKTRTEIQPFKLHACGVWSIQHLKLPVIGSSDSAWWLHFEELAMKAQIERLVESGTRWAISEGERYGIKSWKEAQEQPERWAAIEAQVSCAIVMLAEYSTYEQANTGQGSFIVSNGAEILAFNQTYLRPTPTRLNWRQAIELAADPENQERYEPFGPMFTLAPVGLTTSSSFNALNAPILRRLSGKAAEKESALNWAHEDASIQQAIQKENEGYRQRTAQQVAYLSNKLILQTQRQQMRIASNTKNVSVKEEKKAGLTKALEEMSAALIPVLAGVRNRETEHLGKRVDQIMNAWAHVGQEWPHLRPVLRTLELELDPARCMRARVAVCALDAASGTVYLNIGAGLDTQELKYVFTKMGLHLALGHHERAQGKDQKVWSLACSLKVSGYLQDMYYGSPPPSMPRDAELEALTTAEAIYAHLLEHPKKVQKMGSLRGEGLPDLMQLQDDEGNARALTPEEEERYLKAIRDGMQEAQMLNWAGHMPAGLLRELQSRNAKPIPWRTALISYLSGLVKTPARKRTYTRPSRRASQRIYEPKAARVDEEPGPQHELLMVVDTSGSMEDRDLEEAIGAVIATSKVLGIQRVRVISCDAGATDHGWINVQRLRSNLRLTGGGGTDLRPALALAEQINLHKLTPMLIITDGMFDERFAPTREHAYLMPRGTSLMFHTTAPVFTIKR